MKTIDLLSNSYHGKNLVKLRSQLPTALLPLYLSLTLFTNCLKIKQLILHIGQTGQIFSSFTPSSLLKVHYSYSALQHLRTQSSKYTILQKIFENIGAYSKLEVNNFSTNIWTIKSKWDHLEMRQQIYQSRLYKTVGHFRLRSSFKASGLTM